MALLLFCSANLWAKTASEARAKKAVRGWLKAESQPLGTALGKQITNVETFSDADEQLIYYVVYLQPSGFVIVPADDLVEPIICFVAKGTYNPSDDNPLGALVSRDLPSRIYAARSPQISGYTNVQKANHKKQPQSFEQICLDAQDKWVKLQNYADSIVEPMGETIISEVWVDPFVLSTWGQKTVDNISGGISCYNYYTPGDDPIWSPGRSANYPCGCVAAGMAQLMRYYQHPTAGVGTPSFTIYVDGVDHSVSLRGGNGSGGPYVWSNMVLQPDSSITSPERQAIGALCFDVGVSISMAYTSSGSSASLHDATQSLKDTFGYNNAIYGYNSNNNIGSGLNGMVNPNLDAGYPAALSLSGSSGGHVAICDGYGYNTSTLYHHLNMGWDGLDNAWYNLPYVDAYYTYDSVVGCVYNVFISSSGEIISGRITDLGGNPISQAAITATGTGTYYATSNSQGIYALVNVPSNTSFTVSASKPLHAFTDQYVSTGQSSDWASTSGNLWGVDFVSQSATPPTANSEVVSALSGTTETIILNATDEGYPDPPAQLTFIITSLPTHGRLTDPAAGRITSVPYTLANNDNIVDYWPCTYYTGQDFFGFKANDGGTPPQGGDSQIATITIDVNNVISTTFAPSSNTYAYWPLYTSYHDSRTQVIYLSGEIGDAKTITDLALDFYEAPGQTLNNWTIRMKHTTLSAYPGFPLFETTGWTTVFQGNEPPSPIGWRNFSFQTPFEYNGTDNLLIDFSHNNSSCSTNGSCMVSGTGNNRVLFAYADSTHGDPLDWTSYTLPVSYTEYVPNIKLIATIPAQPITGDFEPDCDVDMDDLGVLNEQWLFEKLSVDIDFGTNGSDGIINFLDWTVFAAAWQSGPMSPNWDPKCDITPQGGDQIIDAKDLAVFVEEWLKVGSYYLNADIAPEPDGDDIVNMLDFAAFAENWLAGLE